MSDKKPRFTTREELHKVSVGVPNGVDLVRIEVPRGVDVDICEISDGEITVRMQRRIRSDAAGTGALPE